MEKKTKRKIASVLKSKKQKSKHSTPLSLSSLSLTHTLSLSFACKLQSSKTVWCDAMAGAVRFKIFFVRCERMRLV